MCGGIYFLYDFHEKKINRILTKDSVRYEKLHQNYLKQDSLNKILNIQDSIQISKFNKLEKSFKQTKIRRDIIRDSVGFLPDL